MTDTSPHGMQKDVNADLLSEEHVDPNPLVQFRRWFDEASSAGVFEPTAMVLATASPDGTPSARVVLLKHFGEEGFVFYTNFESQKGRELLANPRACLLFYWDRLLRQVRLQGVAEKTSRAESEEYFATRPYESRLSAWASPQSTVISGRHVLEENFERYRLLYRDGSVPLPPYWGGFRLKPQSFEFWQGRENRLHDRIRYSRSERGWVIERLAP